MHHEGNLALAIFPLGTSMSALPKTILYRELNLTHVSFPSIPSTNTFPKNKLHHKGKLAHARFPSSTSTSALPKTILHREGNLTHASFPSIMKQSTRTSTLPMPPKGNLTHASLYSIMKKSTNALPKTTTLHHEGKASTC